MLYHLVSFDLAQTKPFNSEEVLVWFGRCAENIRICVPPPPTRLPHLLSCGPAEHRVTL